MVRSCNETRLSARGSKRGDCAIRRHHVSLSPFPTSDEIQLLAVVVRYAGNDTGDHRRFERVSCGRSVRLAGKLPSPRSPDRRSIASRFRSQSGSSLQHFTILIVILRPTPAANKPRPMSTAMLPVDTLPPRNTCAVKYKATMSQKLIRNFKPSSNAGLFQ